ncbi:hypothetical protein LZ32DRAFT_333780 [Colletotrichum eremochloae]|nr:hypothetical protein LZ32DRAFT_333780 [Colletotrichum eremochloae]
MDGNRSVGKGVDRHSMAETRCGAIYDGNLDHRHKEKIDQAILVADNAQAEPARLARPRGVREGDRRFPDRYLYHLPIAMIRVHGRISPFGEGRGAFTALAENGGSGPHPVALSQMRRRPAERDPPAADSGNLSAPPIKKRVRPRPSRSH